MWPFLWWMKSPQEVGHTTQSISLLPYAAKWFSELYISTDICDPGWSYFNGFCYLTSEKCVNWTTAVKCRQENSVLVDVANDEENAYIQCRHNGEKSWLGLNDISTEGNITWADRGGGTFQIGWRISRITLMKRTACMLLVWNTTMNGMMWIVVTVISTLARKVGIAFFPSCSEFSVVTVSSRRSCLCLMVRTFLKFWLKTHRKKASWPVWYTYGILRQLILHLQQCHTRNEWDLHCKVAEILLSFTFNFIYL